MLTHSTSRGYNKFVICIASSLILFIQWNFQMTMGDWRLNKTTNNICYDPPLQIKQKNMRFLISTLQVVQGIWTCSYILLNTLPAIKDDFDEANNVWKLENEYWHFTQLSVLQMENVYRKIWSWSQMLFVLLKLWIYYSKPTA